MSVFYSSEYNKLFLFVATCLVGQPSRMEIFNVSYKGFSFRFVSWKPGRGIRV